MMCATAVDIHLKDTIIPAGTELEIQRNRIPGLCFNTTYHGKNYLIINCQVLDLDPEDFNLSDADRELIYY